MSVQTCGAAVAAGGLIRDGQVICPVGHVMNEDDDDAAYVVCPCGHRWEIDDVPLPGPAPERVLAPLGPPGDDPRDYGNMQRRSGGGRGLVVETTTSSSVRRRFRR